MRECGVEADIVLGPARRVSSPAAAFAAHRHPAAIVLVLAADNVIRRQEEFVTACQQALANDGRIEVFGIPPTRPATSYGYICPGQNLDGSATLAVEAFVEKPDAATATTYVAKGYLWNGGNFMFRADVMLSEIERFETSVAASVKVAVSQMKCRSEAISAKTRSCLETAQSLIICRSPSTPLQM
jgi:mannose-1-phosphate guanylyltransferase/mannose-6-phosphate isomerase